MSAHFEGPNQNDRYKIGAGKLRSWFCYNLQYARRFNLDAFEIFRVTRSVSRTRLRKERCLQMP